MILNVDTVTRMAIQHAWGWYPSQIARWHQVDRELVAQLIADGFPGKALPPCTGCGEPFLPSNPANAYCSDACKWRTTARRKAERKRADAPLVPCKRCGAAYRQSGRGLYCSDACRYRTGQPDPSKRRDTLARPLPIPREGRVKAGQMDDAAFRAELARERRRLDDLPQMDGDLHWRREAGR